MARKPSSAPKRPYVRVTRWRRKRFFMLLEECGNVRAAAELAGLGIGAIYRLRKVEPGFTQKMAAAKAVATARLAEARARSECPCPEGEGEFAGLVIRRCIGGRLMLMSPGRPWWEPGRHDEIFLRALRGSGNFTFAARAAGFTRKAADDQRRARPGFAADCERALADAKPRLEDLLVEYATRWSLASAGEAFEGEPLDERDVDRALRTLAYWERSGRWRATRGAPNMR
jgi:hypothetical protein